MRPDLVADIPLHLTAGTPGNPQNPLPTQITTQIRTLIHTGVLAAGDHLPSTRMLARQGGQIGRASCRERLCSNV